MVFIVARCPRRGELDVGPHLTFDVLDRVSQLELADAPTPHHREVEHLVLEPLYFIVARLDPPLSGAEPVDLCLEGLVL